MNPFADVQVSIPKANLKNKKPSEKDIQTLLLAPNPKTPIGIRDIALLRLLTIYGLEVWQIEQLETRDIDEENEVVYIHSRTGKAQKLFIDEVSMSKISKWLRTRNLFKVDTNAVFISMHWTSGRSTPGKRLSKRGIRLIVDKYLNQIGFKEYGISCKSLRQSASLFQSEK